MRHVLTRPARRRSTARPGAAGTGPDDYLPIEGYAAIGDGRTVALVGRNGSVDWLCHPNVDNSSVFGALLDGDRGGRFVLSPTVPYGIDRRYAGPTNVLETTFRCDVGTVRVMHALTLPTAGLPPGRELVCTVEGLEGAVPIAWRAEPRFGYGLRSTRLGWRAGVPVATSGAEALAVQTWGLGDAEVDDRCISGRFTARRGERTLIALSFAHQEPLVLPARDDVEARLVATIAYWARWAAGRTYTGPWREAVIRSALALKLLVHAPSGAVAAAPTTSLPETIGGERNWDYRFCWVRDAAFTLNALLQLGCSTEADAFYWWLMQASQLTHPRLQVLYRLDGGVNARERPLPLRGYRDSGPVRVGNGAVDQLQLDIYGDLLQMAWIYASSGRPIDLDIGRRLGETANLVCDLWRQPDAGIWEVRSRPEHFTHSKMMCCIALERATGLAERGLLPDRDIDRWRAEAAAVRSFVDAECWSDAERSYVRFAGSEELDASLLLGVLFGYADPSDDRLQGTVDAIRRELSDGPFVRRYTGADGLAGTEGAFLACSFWLAEALARCGRRDEATTLFESLLGLANDVGLYAEEVDPATGSFLGNFPQGLTHLALISAAIALEEA